MVPPLSHTPHRIAIRDPTPPQVGSVCPRYPCWLGFLALKGRITILAIRIDIAIIQRKILLIRWRCCRGW